MQRKIQRGWQRVRHWQAVNHGRELKEMSAAYLLTQFSLATFIATMAPGILVPATKAFLEAMDQGAPWWWGAVGLWLAAFWGIQVMALVVSVSHGRALGEKVFAPAAVARPYRFEPKRPRRLGKRR